MLIPDERRLGCGMHIRSKFHDALLAQDKRAAVPLKHVADLYQIEAECKEQSLDVAARADQCRRRSLPIVDALDHWVDSVHPKLLPKSTLRRATIYAINQRPFFRRCFEDCRFEIDNGRVERRIRKNSLFAGSAEHAQNLAIIQSIVSTCRVHAINPYDYIRHMLIEIQSHPAARIAELMPWRWHPSGA